jgi:ketosteroid isomerase-like protein
LYIRKNINTLVGLYADEITYLPEYKPAIFEIKVLKEFLSDWFKASNIKAYKKKIYQVEVYSDYVLEMGTFRFDYLAIDNRHKEYEGHYMILWKQNESGGLSIVSETFGANKYIEPQDVPYASVKLLQSSFTPTPRVNNKLYTDIIAFDAIVIKAVAEGDGDARANGFTEDAILMSNFDSIRVGMEVIRPKMLKTYTRDVSFNVNHTYFRIYDLGEYVFVTSHYKGGWGDASNGGSFEGNMSNLMKRNGNGKLLMHRQAGNRDSALITGKR